MMGRTRKERERRAGKRFRAAMYGMVTVLLTGLVVTGYYLISNGVIFGKLEIKSNTYKIEEGAVSDMDARKITVTPQNQQGAVPLTSDNEALPKIPPVNGTKATKENPFVVLEIVPELSQQSLSYLVESEEKGLPFNPVELGIKRCNEKSNENGFLNQQNRNEIDVSNAKNNIVPRDYGYFEGNFQGDMRVGGDSETKNPNHYMPYYEIQFLYELQLYSSEISKEDFESKTMHELIVEHPEAFALACPDEISVDLDEVGREFPVYLNRSIQAAFEERNNEGQFTDRNWVKTVEENKDVTKTFQLTVDAGAGVTEDDFQNLTMEQLAAKYPDLFARDDNGTAIPSNVLNKNGKWERNKTQKKTTFTKGYFIKVGKGQGEYTLNGYNAYTNNNELTATKTGTDTDMWNYVESESYPEESKEVFNYYSNEQDNIDNKLREDGDVGTYIRMSYILHDENQWNIYAEGRYVSLVSDVYTFDYAKYVYKLKYAGLRINDILRYSLLIRDTPEEYENLYVQVIVVTPDMINEMDANDTENTIDYIERADVIYLSEYNDGYNETATDVWKFINLYETYADGGSGEKFQQSDEKKLKTFSENDLEWWDCLKLVKRLSTTRNLPMMMTKLVGSEAVMGVNGEKNIVQYIHAGKTDANGSNIVAAKKCEPGYGAINNISKLYYMLVQFNLLDRKTGAEASLAPGEEGYRRTFMDDIFPALKVMELNADQQCGSSHPAKYTGYYERSPLAESDAYDQEYKERSYYCWNKFTFVPTDLDAEVWGAGMDNDEYKQILSEKYGFLKSYFYANTFQNSDNDKRGVGSTNGSNGHDGQNVTVAREYVNIASDGNNDNLNESIPTKLSVVDGMMEIIRNIGDQYDRAPNELLLNILKNKSVYTKMSDKQILLDFSSEAEYRNADRKINFKCIFSDSNNEDAIIRSLTLVKTEDSPSGKTLKLCDDSGHARETEQVKFSNGDDPVTGWRIMAGDNITKQTIPFKLSDWLDGYTVIRVEWTTRNRVERNSNTSYNSREGVSYVTIGERALSNLE